MAILFLLLSVCVASGYGTDVCTGTADGNIEIGCRSYMTCVHGVGTLHDCPATVTTSVYNSVTGQCEDPINVPPPCGQLKDCTHLGSQGYADLDNGCRSFYTCNRGTFFGHNNCSPENIMTGATCGAGDAHSSGTPDLTFGFCEGLVFDEHLQTCNWPRNVLPPCGTKAISITSRPTVIY